jgi:hypothetical protein
MLDEDSLLVDQDSLLLGSLILDKDPLLVGILQMLYNLVF